MPSGSKADMHGGYEFQSIGESDPQHLPRSICQLSSEERAVPSDPNIIDYEVRFKDQRGTLARPSGFALKEQLMRKCEWLVSSRRTS